MLKLLSIFFRPLTGWSTFKSLLPSPSCNYIFRPFFRYCPGKDFPSGIWTDLYSILCSDLMGWGEVFQSLIVQGTWSPRKAKISIKILDPWVIKLALCHWTLLFQRIRQTHFFSSSGYINHHRSQAALKEVRLLGGEPLSSNFCCSHSRIEKVLNGWSRGSGTFISASSIPFPCQKWGTPDVDILACRLKKLPRFVVRTKDPLLLPLDALIIPFALFWLSSSSNFSLIAVQNRRPRRAWYTDTLKHLGHDPLPLPNRPDLLSQGPLLSLWL